MKLSASRVNLFESCPLQYHLRYVKKAYTAKKYQEQLMLGSLVHGVLEHLAEYPIEENIPKCVKKAIDDMKDPLTPELVKKAKDMVEDWFSPEKFELECLGTEYKFDFTIEGIPVLGYIDRIERVDEKTIRVIDYKSGGRIFTEDDIRGSNQLLMYAMAAYKEWQPENVIVCYDMVAYDKRVEILATYDDIIEKFDYLKLIYDSIVNKMDQTAITGGHCNWCEYKGTCPEYKAYVMGELNLPNINVLETKDANEVLTELDNISNKIKVLEAHKSKIRAWLTNEMIEGGLKQLKTEDFVLSLTSRTSMNYNPVTIATVFEDRMHEVLKVKKTDVDKLMKTLSPEIKAAILSTATRREGAPFLKMKKK